MPNEIITKGNATTVVPSNGMADSAFHWLRNTLGTVAPKDPRTRRLGPRRWRLELLAEACDRETFVIIASWLASDALPSEQTKRGYTDDILMWARVARELGGHERFFVKAVTPAMVETWVTSQRGRRVSGRSINRRLSALSSLARYEAFRKKEPFMNPVSRYDRVKVDQNDMTSATPVLEVPEFERLVGCAESSLEALVPSLIYTVAGRVSECCEAKLSDIRSVGDKKKLDLRRKGNKGRVFSLPETLFRLIEVSSAGRTEGHLFVNSDGKSLTRHDVKNLVIRMGKRSSVLPGRDVTPHVLRATKLTHMHDQGVELTDIQEFADHANVTTTLRYIKRRENDALREKFAQDAANVYEGLVSKWL